MIYTHYRIKSDLGGEIALIETDAGFGVWHRSSSKGFSSTVIVSDEDLHALLLAGRRLLDRKAKRNRDAEIDNVDIAKVIA